jgi:maltose O-acetyltransferase
MLGHLVSQFRTYRFRSHFERLLSRGLIVGRNVSFQDGVFLDPDHCFLIKIGDDCVFAPNVRVIAHDASSKFVVGYTKLGRVTIGSRCFIGDSVLILPGVSIGNDCIIGAGSVVRHDIAAGSVAAGNPARVLASMEQYRERHRQAIDKGKTFDSKYHIEAIDVARRTEVLDSLDRGPTYIE